MGHCAATLRSRNPVERFLLIRIVPERLRGHDVPLSSDDCPGYGSFVQIYKQRSLTIGQCGAASQIDPLPEGVHLSEKSRSNSKVLTKGGGNWVSYWSHFGVCFFQKTGSLFGTVLGPLFGTKFGIKK